MAALDFHDFELLLRIFGPFETDSAGTGNAIERLVRFCETLTKDEIEKRLFELGDNNRASLQRLKEIAWGCRRFIALNADALKQAYVEGKFGKWLTEYSRERLFIYKDDSIRIHSGILDEETGEIEYPQAFELMPVDVPDEDIIDAGLSEYDSEDEEIPEIPEEYRAEEEKDLEAFYDWLNGLSDEEMMQAGMLPELAVRNPLLSPETQEATDSLRATTELVLRIIKLYVDNEPIRISSGKEADAALYDKLAGVLNGKVFDQPLDGGILARALQLDGTDGLTILPRKNRLWVRILHILSLDGPSSTREKGWFDAALRRWGLQEDGKKRIYDPVARREEDTLDGVKNVLRQYTGEQTLNFDRWLDRIQNTQY